MLIAVRVFIYLCKSSETNSSFEAYFSHDSDLTTIIDPPSIENGKPPHDECIEMANSEHPASFMNIHDSRRDEALTISLLTAVASSDHNLLSGRLEGMKFIYYLWHGSSELLQIQ